MGRFDHRATRPARGPADILRWKLLDPLRARRPRSPHGDGPVPVRANDGSALRELAASLTWIGHATFVLRLAGRTIATDPVWSERIQGVIPRQSPPGVALADTPPLDLVLVSHNHYDHLDLPTLKRIGPRAKYLVPHGNARVLRSAGLTDVVELDWWETWRDGALEVTLVPARHWSMRAPWDRNDGLWGGWFVRGPEGAAYHSGDTAHFDGFAEIADRCGAPDWAMLPIGAYEPRWFMEPQHMNPDDAFSAFSALRARHFVAMHWGTFKLTDEPLLEPPARIREIWSEAGVDPERLWLMDVGETRALP